MAAQLNQVFFPAGFPELFSAWNRFPAAVPFAGGTGIIRSQNRQSLELPPVILSLDKLEDMHRITRNERYLEIGAMVQLSQIVRLGKIVPEALSRCLASIGGTQLRNVATIGGNVCFPAQRLDASAALTALDAQYELRTAQASRWVSASRFSSIPGPTALGPQELLTRVRIPLDQWDYSAYQKFGSRNTAGNAVVFIMKTQKNVLSDLRVVYKTDVILRDKTCETLLVGKRLPLSRRVAAEFTQQWETFISGIPNVEEQSRKELVNFIEANMYNLSS